MKIALADKAYASLVLIVGCFLVWGAFDIDHRFKYVVPMQIAVLAARFLWKRDVRRRKSL